MVIFHPAWYFFAYPFLVFSTHFSGLVRGYCTAWKGSNPLDLTNYCFHFYSAEGLAYIMNELFGGVVYAGIDTDKHRYPIGKISVLVHFTHYLSSRWLQAYS